MTLYKHRNNTDVAILVLKKHFIPEKSQYKLKVKWMNIVNPNNIFYTGVQETIAIDKSKFNKEWEVIG
jgi:hypothetical protein